MKYDDKRIKELQEIESNLMFVFNELSTQPEIGVLFSPETSSYDEDMEEIRELIVDVGEYGLAFEFMKALIDAYPFKLSNQALKNLHEYELLLQEHSKTEIQENLNFVLNELAEQAEFSTLFSQGKEESDKELEKIKKLMVDAEQYRLAFEETKKILERIPFKLSDKALENLREHESLLQEYEDKKIENILMFVWKELRSQTELAVLFPQGKKDYDEEFEVIRKCIICTEEYRLAFEFMKGLLDTYPFKLSEQALKNLREYERLE